MIFLGTTFCSGKQSLLPSPTALSKIYAVHLFDGVYNEIFLSADSSLTVETYGEWTEDTQFYATFDNGLDASSSDVFNTTNTDCIVIRRREKGETKWITIFVKEMKTVSDFNDFKIRDTYARAEADYEYCISSFLNGIENSYIIETVYSDFDGYYITDKDCLYGTVYDVDGCDTSRNMTVQTLELHNNKYMSVVSNSMLNCDSGSIIGSFLKIEDDCITVDKIATFQNRKDVMNRLAEHKPLILKIHDGRIWIIRVTGNPTDTIKGHPDLRQITFEWVEIGDINDMRTLYELGFSDVDSRWW